ncbi:MAG TPA: hypothetical protein DCY07_04285, partial [Rhodospirillaceae bacterium]|nr:hypothetical protein [Rhodospirillaceae bacterium]
MVGGAQVKVYKLTDKNGQTLNNTQWGEGVRHEATGTGTELCSDGFIHAYESPEMAAFMNPSHGNFANPIMWEADGEGEPVRDGQLKCGFKALATVRAVPMVEITTEQRVEIALRCAMVNCKSKPWLAWAEKWLANDDRSGRAAAAAAWAAAAAAA